MLDARNRPGAEIRFSDRDAASRCRLLAISAIRNRATGSALESATADAEVEWAWSLEGFTVLCSAAWLLLFDILDI